MLALSAGDIYTLYYISVIQNEGKNELNISLYTLTQKERVYLALVFILPIACFIIVKVKISYEAGIGAAWPSWNYQTLSETVTGISFYPTVLTGYRRTRNMGLTLSPHIGANYGIGQLEASDGTIK